MIKLASSWKKVTKSQLLEEVTERKSKLKVIVSSSHVNPFGHWGKVLRFELSPDLETIMENGESLYLENVLEAYEQELIKIYGTTTRKSKLDYYIFVDIEMDS